MEALFGVGVGVVGFGRMFSRGVLDLHGVTNERSFEVHLPTLAHMWCAWERCQFASVCVNQIVMSRLTAVEPAT